MLQEVVNCVAHARVRRGGAAPNTHATFSLEVGAGEPLGLAGDSRLHLSARLRYLPVLTEAEPGPWRVTIVAYQYTLLDADHREIVAFHLHPEGSSHVTTPHLHLGAGAGQLRADLAAAHIPTGPITLAAVVRLSIEGFAARPLRRDWDRVLRRCDDELAGAALTSPYRA